MAGAMPDRERFAVRCGACGHEWVAVYTPMPLFKAAEVLRTTHCPRCGQDGSRIYHSAGNS